MNYIDKMMDIIKKQFVAVMDTDPDFYSQYKIILSNEQQYVKNKDRDPKAIYIVAKFLAGPPNFGQFLMPVNFNALGEANKVEVCQKLLLDYAQTFNLGEPEEFTDEQQNNYIVKQVYTQPQVMSNFNGTWNEFRSLFYMTGTFLIGKNSMPIQSIVYYENATDTEGTEINFINTSWDFTIQLDSQAFYGTNSRTKSKSKIGTLGLNMTVYFTNNKLCKKIKGIAFNNETDAPNGIKTKFYLDITFVGDSEPYTNKMPFSLVNASTVQNMGEFPLLAIALTN